MADWKEIEKLQATFQKAQQETSKQRFVSTINVKVMLSILVC